MDRHSLTSDPQPPLSHRYVAGVLKDGKSQSTAMFITNAPLLSTLLVTVARCRRAAPVPTAGHCPTQAQSAASGPGSRRQEARCCRHRHRRGHN